MLQIHLHKPAIALSRMHARTIMICTCTGSFLKSKIWHFPEQDPAQIKHCLYASFICLFESFFYVCKANMHRVSEFHAQFHRPRRQKAHAVCFHYFTKAQCFVVIALYRFERYSYLCDQKWRSILRASEHTGAFICPAERAAIQLPLSTQTRQKHTFSHLG